MNRTRTPHHWERISEPDMPGEGRDFLRDVVVPGGVAGTLAGLTMMLLYMLGAAAFGQGFWAGPGLVAGLFFREANLADLQGPGPVVVGLLLHLAVSGALGTLFALLIPRRWVPPAGWVPIALFYGMVIYVVMMFFVVPYGSPPMAREVIHPLWFVGHLVYAAVLALIVPLRRMAHGPRWVVVRREVRA